jgi:hypothetical protein
VPASGWLGPDDEPTSDRQYWDKYKMLLAFAARYEATGDERLRLRRPVDDSAGGFGGTSGIRKAPAARARGRLARLQTDRRARRRQPRRETRQAT